MSHYESSKDDSSVSKSGFKSRGRIAQVLAQARAEAQNTTNITLKEPSRPFTPASYDAKTSIDLPDSYNIQSQNMKYPINYISKSFKSLEKRSSDPSLSIGKTSLSKSNSKDNSPSSSSSSLSRDSLSNNDASIQLLFYDIRDLLISIDGSLSQLESSSTHADHQKLKPTQLSSFIKILSNFNSYLDHICRLIRDCGSKLSSDAIIIVYEASTLFSRIVASTSSNHVIKAMASRYLIQLQVPIIQYRMSTEAAVTLRRGCQTLYDVLTSLSSDKSNTDDVSSSSDGVNSIATEVDHLSIYLNIMWTRFSADFQVETSLNNNVVSENTPKLFVILLEGIIYAVGIIRYYSNTDQNRKRLIYLGIVESLSQGLHTITSCFYQYQRQLKKSTSSTDIISSSLTTRILPLLPKILSQATATLRNFSLDQSGRNLLLTGKVVIPLCQLLLLYKHESDLQLNILRVLAKLSLLEPFRAQINSKPSHIKCLADVVISEAVACLAVSDDTIAWPCWTTWPILSRVGFTLGNLTTSNNANRILIGRDCKCLKPLVTLLQASVKHLKQAQASTQYDMEKSSNGNMTDNNKRGERDYYDDVEYDEDDCEEVDDGASDNVMNESRNSQQAMAITTADETVDACVKLLRLLANLSIDESIGKYIASRVEPFQMLLDLLSCAEHEEELLLNIVATATNITYYACHSDDDISEDMERILLQLTLKLSESLFHYNDELVLESARALGNLTRLNSVVPALLSRRVDEALLLLLQHANLDIVSVVTGALVNLTRNPTSRDSLILLGVHATVDPLKSALRRSSLKNLPLSILVCQVLHNLLTNDRSISIESSTSSAMKLPPAAVAAMFQQQRENFLLSIPQSLIDTISELVDCARDLETSSNQSNDKAAAEEYADFTRVGIAVLDIVS